ncbi:MAG: SpoIID/LytB domain-containing protein [Patescibacteria group bacterium]|nr:SpoIID/LytB domain-containing protein [Patescibacteria group bacterium]
MLCRSQKQKFKKFIKIGLKFCVLVLFFNTSFVGGFSFLKPIQAASYTAQRVEQSYPYVINLTPGKGFTFWVKFKNTGTATWRNSGDNLVALNLAKPYGRHSTFQHDFWPSYYCPTRMTTTTVKPGEIGLFRFAIQAPEQEGLYVENFQIASKGIDWIQGGTLELVIKIEDPNAPRTIIVPETPDQAEIIAENNSTPDEEISSLPENETQPSIEEPRFNPTRYEKKDLNEFPVLNLVNSEPDIRIGLYSTEDPVKITGNGPYQVFDAENNLLFTQTQGEETEIIFDFDIQRYMVNVGGKRILMTDKYLRFIPLDNTILEITTNKTRDEWGVYSRFRGKLELRYVPQDNNKFWVINELTMEDYLKGMAETGNVNPMAYLESMTIAERTYALYNILNPSRHQVRHFTLTSHPGDQYYRGYDRELMSPNVVQAVENTQGLVATYNNQIAITPYFARSDGMTKLWSQVWGGSDKPWIQPKYVPYDDGEELFGHGVGMSAWGAWDMAKNRDMNFEEIIKYFYTDVEVNKAW